MYIRVYTYIFLYVYIYTGIFSFYIRTDANISKHTDRRPQDPLSSRKFRNPLEILPCRFDIKNNIKLMFCLSIVRKPFTRSSPPVAPKPPVTDFAPKESFRTEIPLKARWYQRKHITVYVYGSINVYIYIYMYVLAFVFYVHTDAKISKHTDRRRQDALSSRIFRNPLEILLCRFNIKKYM
jgi:hypothetical protein